MRTSTHRIPFSATVLELTPRRVGWLVATLLMVVHLYVALRMHRPSYLADEFGYLGNAHQLLYGTGAVGDGFYAGYSMLLLPARLVTEDSLTFYRLTLVTNALLAVSVLPLLYSFLRRTMPEVPAMGAMVAASLTTLIPALLVASGYAMSEQALIPSFVLAAILIHRGSSEGSRKWWAAAGATVGYLTVVNPRGFYVIAAFVIAVGIDWRLRRDRTPYLVAALVALATVTAAGRYLTASLPGSDDTRGATQGVLQPLLDSLNVAGITASAGRLSGSLMYLGVASAGTLLIGLVALVARATELRHGPSARAVTATFVVASITISGILISGRSLWGEYLRYDLPMYGRYLECLFAPLVATGFAVFFVPQLDGWRHRLLDTSWLWSPLAIVGFGAIATVWSLPVAQIGTGVMPWANVLSLRVYDLVTDDWSPVRFALLGAVVAAPVLLLLRRMPAVGSAAAALVFLVSSMVALHAHMIPESQSEPSRGGIAAAIEEAVGEGIDTDCIAWRGSDQGVIPGRSLRYVRFYEPRSTFEHWEFGTQPCGRLALILRDHGAPAPGAERLATGAATYLWLLPEGVQSD